MSWYDFPPSRPIPADGIKAKSRSGDIGESWWSRRFIEVLEAMGMGTRLQRGRRYARAGQVLDVAMKPGEVVSHVQGSRAKPYKVRIATPTLHAHEWARIEQALASRAVFLAKLLAGEMPKEVEEAFGACSTSLFPSSPRDLSTECSCPDWANPCKHVAAVFYILAESFDEDPFRIFAWRGRSRDELMDGLRSHEGAVLAGPRASGGPAGGGWSLPLVEVGGRGEALSSFYDFPGAFEQPGPTGGGVRSPLLLPDGVAPEAILLSLDDLALSIAGQSFSTLLVPAYRAMSEHASARLVSDAGDG